MSARAVGALLLLLRKSPSTAATTAFALVSSTPPPSPLSKTEKAAAHPLSASLTSTPQSTVDADSSNADPSNTDCASSSSSDDDAALNRWCSTVGISSDNVIIQTTPRSVGKRGVFALRDCDEGDVMASIPPQLVLTQHKAEVEWTGLSDELKRLRGRRPTTQMMIQEESSNDEEEGQRIRAKGRWFGRALDRVARRILPKRTKRRRTDVESSSTITDVIRDDDEHDRDDGAYWPSELTLYALAALRQNHTTWSPWIQSWTRDDPTHDLFASGVKCDDERAVNQTATRLLQMLPDGELSMDALRPALHVRLEQIDSFRERYGSLIEAVMTTMTEDEEEGNVVKEEDGGEAFVTSSTAAAAVAATAGDTMYGTLCSRAVNLGSGITGIVPLHDMINHSPDPNVVMGFDGDWLQIVATRPIESDEELLLCYNNDVNDDDNDKDREKGGGEWDEDVAVWTLFQWGVPCPKGQWEEARQQRRERRREKEWGSG